MQYWTSRQANCQVNEAFFQALRHVLDREPYPALLESRGPITAQSRYSFYAASPHTKLEIFRTAHTSLRHQLNQWSQNAFRSGHAAQIFGFLSYDAGRLLEKLPAYAADDIALPYVWLGAYPLYFVHDRQTDEVTLEGLPGHAQQAEKWLKALTDKLNHPNTDEFERCSEWESNMDWPAYRDRFDQVQDYLHSGDCYQINLAQRWQAAYRGNPLTAYERLLEKNGAPFSGFIDLGEVQILSVSPERFIRVESGQCQTRPIKGTRPRVADPIKDEAQRKDLANSEKDRAENVMIVDLLRNDFAKSCRPGTIQVPELFAIESYPAVHHLVSTITGTLRPDRTALDLLLDAFPGGSITGAPKIRAMEIIEMLEPHRRQIYCGSLVRLSSNGDMDSSIAIRTLVTHKQMIYCWGGGGLVADSEARNEYQETLDKVSRILPTL